MQKWQFKKQHLNVKINIRGPSKTKLWPVKNVRNQPKKKQQKVA